MARKQTTCFSDEQKIKIRSEIGELAADHNRLILSPVMAKLTMTAALVAFVAPENRPLALGAHRRFGANLRSSAYSILFKDVPGLTESGARLRFWWDNLEGFRDPDCFVVADSDKNLSFSSAIQPTSLAAELRETVREWTANAAQWGLVVAVFDWLNDHVAPRDHAHAVYLFPALLPVVARFDKAWAQTLAAMRPPKREAVGAKFLPGLQRANKFLAGSFLLPQCGDAVGGPVYMGVDSPGMVSHPDWPWPIAPELKR